MGTNEWKGRLERVFLQDGLVGGHLKPVLDAESECGEFVTSHFHGQLVLGDSFQAFFIDTLQLAEARYRASPLFLSLRWYPYIAGAGFEPTTRRYVTLLPDVNSSLPVPSPPVSRPAGAADGAGDQGVDDTSGKTHREARTTLEKSGRRYILTRPARRGFGLGVVRELPHERRINMSSKVACTLSAMIVSLWVGSIGTSLAQDAQTKPVELDVPFVPTRQGAVDAMLKLAKVTSKDYVFDLGCGDGRIVIAAAKTYKARGFGVDLDPQRIRESEQNASKAGVTDRVKFKLADIMVTDVREASVVALFLLDSVNLQLRPRLFAQLKPGARVVSNTFHMADWKADKTLRHGEAYEGIIHLWIIPAPVGGTWEAKTKTSGGEISSSLKLEQQFQVVTGVVRVPKGPEVPITDVSVNGKQIKFKATPRIAGREVRIVYEATVEGDVMKGTQEWLTGPSAGTYPWTATRNRLDVTGRWLVEPPRHVGHNGTLSIRRKDGGLLATYLRDGKDQKEVSLPAFYLWGSSIRFEIPSDGTPLIFTGSLAGDAGGGAVSVGAEGAKMRWTAKRLAAR